MIEPYRGRIYDYCHGTGGFYVQSNRFVLAYAGCLDDISVYGQERKPETYRLARMNLAIRGITGDLRWNNEGTLLKDAFPDMRFDFNLANPPFNIKDWGGEFRHDDAGGSGWGPAGTRPAGRLGAAPPAGGSTLKYDCS
jgi:type I restriction enzyme M protein